MSEENGPAWRSEIAFKIVLTSDDTLTKTFEVGVDALDREHFLRINGVDTQSVGTPAHSQLSAQSQTALSRPQTPAFPPAADRPFTPDESQQSLFLRGQQSAGQAFQIDVSAQFFQQPGDTLVDGQISELEANIAFLESRKDELAAQPRRGGHGGRIAAQNRSEEIDRLRQQQDSLQDEIDALTRQPDASLDARVVRTPAEAIADITDTLETRREALENEPRLGGHGGRIQAQKRSDEIDAIDQDLARIEADNRPLLDETVDNETSRQFHADAAGIDRELLDITIEHEGGNFHSSWRGPFFPTIQEVVNDLADIGSPIADTSVGYAQIQPRNAVEIAADTFDLDLSHEDARERLSSNDNFSNAIAAEFLARRSDMIDPEHRTNRVIFTSYAAHPETIDQFNDINWDFGRAEQLVADGELDQGTFNDLSDRYFVHYDNARD